MLSKASSRSCNFLTNHFFKRFYTHYLVGGAAATVPLIYHQKKLTLEEDKSNESDLNDIKKVTQK